MGHINDENVKELSEALKENTTLKQLDLSCECSCTHFLFRVIEVSHTEHITTVNEIGTPGAQYLVEALKKNTTLEVLHLSDNNITDKGARAFNVLNTKRAKQIHITLYSLLQHHALRTVTI